MAEKKRRILVVDDEKFMVTVVKDRLEASGYEVLTAGDGQEALEKARSEGPDLIILDIMMPKLDGYQVCRMLKFDEKYNKIPIILFTARAQSSDELLGKEVGADAYVVKPFTPSVLLAKIKELLDKNK